jgi:nitroreductase
LPPSSLYKNPHCRTKTASLPPLQVGSNIIGLYDRKKIGELLHIPEEKQFGAVIALGYPFNDTIRTKKRKAFEEITRFV